MCDNIQGYVVGLAINQDEDGMYYATCPGLKGVLVHGETKDEAKQNAIEAIGLIMDVRHARGESLPESEFITIIRKPKEPVALGPSLDNVFFPHPEAMRAALGNEQRP